MTAVLSGIWEPVKSDIAIHGLAYMGVLLTVVGILGFLLFAFVDLPDAAQPFVELFIAAVFFGWGWLLRRQQATLVGKAMDLVGGIVLPLVLFAGLVDGAPFPPDFEDEGLVVALVVAALLLAAAYGWVGSRHPGSMLRYLVGPLIWLAAMSAGFAFKTDEPLFSDAITRPVSMQPALAALAAGLTLAALGRRTQHRLSQPTMVAGLVAVPVCFLLTVTLTASNGWDDLVPIVVLAIGVFGSTEALSRWFEQERWLPVIRPILLGGVLFPLVPILGAGWAGLVAVLAYLVLGDIDLRLGESELEPLALVGAGWLVGSVLAFAEPWAALCGFAATSLWVGYRYRLQPESPVAGALLVVGVVAPWGFGRAVVLLLDGSMAWAMLSAMLVAVAAWVRFTKRHGRLWMTWPTVSALAVGFGSIVAVWAEPQNWWTPIALVGVTATVGLGPGFRVLRWWAGCGIAVGTLWLGLDAFDVPFDARIVTFALVGLALVTASAAFSPRLAGHAAAVGHLLGLGSLVSSHSGTAGTTVLGAWTAGWVVSVVAAGLDRESLTTVIERGVSRVTGRDADYWAGWVAPLVMVSSIPPFVLAVANLWDAFADHRSWTGIVMSSVALGYGATVRVRFRRVPLGRVLSLAAIVSSLIGVAVSAPDPWPSIASSAAIIVVAFLLVGRWQAPGFVWVAWIMSFVLILLLANRAGVGVDSMHLVSLGWGGLMLIGGLIVDDVRSGRRQPGEGLRTPWLLHSVVLGALAVPVSLGPVFTEAPEVYGWWSLGAAVLYATVAGLLRAGSVTAAAYALGAVAAVGLSPWPLMDRPWRLVVVCAPLIVISWYGDRRAGDARQVWLRWDLAPLIVAHGVAGVALAVSLGAGEAGWTALAFGVLSMGLGGLRRRWEWVDAGNALVVAGAADLGWGWFALALAVTAVRGGVVASFTSGVRRVANHVAGAASAGLAWVAVLVWSDSAAANMVAWSGPLWGSVLLVVSLLWRFQRSRHDSVAIWGGLGVAGLSVVSLVALSDPASRIEGPWLSVSYLMFAVSVEVAWRLVGSSVRLVQVPAVGVSWLTLSVGLGWDTGWTANLSAVLFGAGSVVVGETARLLRSRLDAPARLMGRGWLGLGAAGVMLAVLVADLDGAGVLWRVLGVGLFAVGAGRAAAPLIVGWLREVAVVSTLGALTLLSVGFGWPDAGLTAAVVVLGVGGTLGALWLWRGAGRSPWIRSLAVLGVGADVEALYLALGALPDRALLIALIVSLGIQAVAFGVVWDRPQVLAAGPPAFAAAFLLAVGESVSGSAQWYTAPLGLVVLAEVEILRSVVRRNGGRGTGLEVPAAEGVGVGLLVVPAWVEMFGSGIALGLVAFAGAFVCLLWAIITRVRRRLVTAGAIAAASAILMIAAAATVGAPDSAFWWIVAIGVGFAVMLVAALIEAYRSKKGRIMGRLNVLTEGWS